MKCALASMGFINEDIEYNKNVIIETMIKYAKEVDIIVFGEAFLQGFYGATFEVEHDNTLAISQNDSIIKVFKWRKLNQNILVILPVCQIISFQIINNNNYLFIVCFYQFALLNTCYYYITTNHFPFSGHFSSNRFFLNLSTYIRKTSN